MSCNTFVHWHDECPTADEIDMCLQDYVRGLAVAITRNGNVWLVTLPGVHSFPFDRVGPANESMRAAAILRQAESDGSPRWRSFEVSWDEGRSMTVTTRQDDEITMNIAHGFAELCARGWNGRLES